MSSSSSSSSSSACIQALLASAPTLSLSNISPDHSTITLQNRPFPSSTQCTFPKTKTNEDGSTTTTMLTYSLLSLVLQIYDPKISVLQYRNICKKYTVKDNVKPLDKETVLRYFRSGGGSGPPPPPPGAAPSDHRHEDNHRSHHRDKDDGSHTERNDRTRHRKESSSHRDRHHSSSEKGHRSREERDRDREERRRKSHEHRRDHRDGKHAKRERSSKKDEHHRSSDRDKRKRPKTSHHAKEESGSSGRKPQREKVPMTQDQLFQNLNAVVGRRTKSGGKAGNAMAAPGHHRPRGEGDGGESMDVERCTAADSGMAQRGGGEHHRPADPNDATDHSDHHREDPPSLEDDLEEERRRITECLSCDGYQAEEIPAEVLARDKVEVDKIMSFEIPVGDSASILRCGAPSMSSSAASNGKTTPQKIGGPIVTPDGGEGTTRDFKRVLALYSESLKADTKESSSSSRYPTPSSKSHQRPNYKGTTLTPHSAPKQNPIIIVPNAMTSAITMVNAHKFFQDSIFQTRQSILKSLGAGAARKNTKSVPPIRRTVASRFGGGTVEYELMDNPALKLKTREDWDRVVAVVPQGAAWQFKGWKMGPGAWKGGSGGGKGVVSPVDVFANAFGFYVGYEGTPLPKDLQGWSVKKGIVSRDKRGFDSVVLASFWNGLDEWMSVHKRDYLPKSGDL